MAMITMRELATALSENEKYRLGVVSKNEARQAARSADVLEQRAVGHAAVDVADARDIDKIAAQVVRQRRDRRLGGGPPIGVPAVPHRPLSHPLSPRRRRELASDVAAVEEGLRQASAARPESSAPTE